MSNTVVVNRKEAQPPLHQRSKNQEAKDIRLFPAKNKENGDFPEIQLTFDDNKRSSIFLATTYFPAIVDQSRMKSSLQRLINRNPELSYRCTGSNTMGYIEGHSAVPFLVVTNKKASFDFEIINTELSKNPNRVFEFGMMKEFVDEKDFFVGDYHQYFGNGHRAHHTPVFALQLTYDGSGGTWITRWVMHSFGDGSSSVRLFYDLIQGYNNDEYCTPRYFFGRRETFNCDGDPRDTSGYGGWDTSEFPFILRFLFGCCKARNSWASHRLMYSPVRMCKRVFSYDMVTIRFDIQADRKRIDEIGDRLSLQDFVSTGDVLGGMIWMALSLACHRQIQAALVKDCRKRTDKKFCYGNRIIDMPLDGVQLPQASIDNKCVDLPTLAIFVDSVRTGRLRDNDTVNNTIGDSTSTSPVLTISNTTKFDKSLWANVDKIPMKGNHDAWIMKSLPQFHVFAFIIKEKAGYGFVCYLPTSVKNELKDELSRVNEIIFSSKSMST